MQLTPRYDGPPLLRFELPLEDPSVPMLRQRRRLGDVLAGLPDDAWAAASRCEGWAVRDVIAHLVGTNQFWSASIAAGRRGDPTRFLATFDPVSTPPLMVEPMRALPPGELLARYRASVDDLAGAVDGLGDAGLRQLAEAPPGHVEIAAVLLHALWDAWIHERDVLLPLGLEQVVEPDEVADCLVYVAALGPSFQAMVGSTRSGALVVDASHPATAFVVEAGATVRVRAATAGDASAPRLAGDAVALVEGLSFRAPLDASLADEHRWLLAGLDAVFDTAPAGA
jgi:uncharacterized protein (TIGR03083 family)